MKTIEISVSPAGKVEVTTKGYKGASCKDASKFIEQALGEVMEERKTVEFYQKEIQQAKENA